MCGDVGGRSSRIQMISRYDLGVLHLFEIVITRRHKGVGDNLDSYASSIDKSRNLSNISARGGNPSF